MKKIRLFTIILISLVIIFVSKKICWFEDYSPTVIIENNKFTNPVNHNLYKGDKVTGEFVANNNNLGIISVNFNTHWNINTDYLQFSIKERGQDKWYYTNKYKVDQFQNNQYFPFGFPEINNSKDKTYQIEIESLAGTITNSVMVSPDKEFLSKYSFPKNYLLQNKSQIPTYLLNKTESYFRHLNISNYVFIVIITTIFYFFIKSKKGKILEQYINDKKDIIKKEQSIFYWYFWTLFLITIISITAIIIKRHSESSEWLAYMLSAIISFFTLNKFNIFNKKINSKTIKKTLIFGILILVAQLTFFKFFIEIISWRYLLIACLSLIPAIIYNNRSIENFLKILMINLFSIICVTGYFFLDIDSFSLTQFLISLLFVTIIPFLIIKNNFSAKSIWLKIICISALIIFTVVTIDKPIEYHHYSFYIGPAYEIAQGKSILTQAPSQYGYLSVHFIKSIISPFGINFNSFHGLNISLYVIYFFCAFLIIKKITKNVLIATIFSFVAVGFQTSLATESAYLYPSCGPLRFGIGMLMVLFTFYFKNNRKIFIPTLLASIAIFWSIETAIYIIPAWIFTLVCQSYIDSPKIKIFLIKTAKQLGVLFGLIILIFTTIFLIEWNHTKLIPNISTYLQYANTYTDGFCSELIPKFGNHYIVIAILLLGLTLSVFVTLNKIKNDFTLTLNFLTIHNIAIFSYFVSRSHQNNAVNISIFILIEAILCYKIIESIFFKKNRKDLLKLIIFPTILFITFFTIRSYENIFHKERLHYSTINTLQYVDSYKKLSEKYGLNQDNVLIVSKDYSTDIITNYKIKTKLPFNPCLMTTLLPNYQEKYLIPNLNNITIGTTLVYTKDISYLIDSIEEFFTLKPVKQLEKNEFFDLFVFENKTDSINEVK